MNDHRNRTSAALVLIFAGLGCGGSGRSPTEPGLSPTSSLDARTGSLTERLESANFVFHFAPGDNVQVERSEAYHQWAVGFLGVTPPKKIDFYKYRTVEEQTADFGERFGGRAFPPEFAVVTHYRWHNHECMHLYVSLMGSPPRIFAEGMVVAHEFDPYNNVWVSQWNRADPPREPYIDVARRLRAQGLLYPIDEILESQAFNARVETEPQRIAYPQAGIFVSYLVEMYGLENMKQIVQSVPYSASRDAIQRQFQAVYGITVAEAEAGWLAYLDEGLPAPYFPELATASSKPAAGAAKL